MAVLIPGFTRFNVACLLRSGSRAAVIWLLLLAAGATQAADYTWNNGSGDRLWNTTSLNWNDGTSAVAWVDSNRAVFGTSALGTVTIEGTRSITGLSLGSSGTITGGTLELGSGELALTNGSQNVFLTIESNITGGALTKSAGRQSLVLAGTNTYAGPTTVNSSSSQGFLVFAKRASFYNADPTQWTPAKLIVNSGAAAVFRVGGSGEFTTADVTTLLTNLTTGLNNNGLRSGSVVGFDASNAGGVFTIADNITNSSGTGGGAVRVRVQGTGTVLLSGVNTHSGGTEVGATSIDGGTLRVGNNQALGLGTLIIQGGRIESSDDTPRDFANAVSMATSFTFGSSTTGNLRFQGTNDTGSAGKTFTVSNAVTEFSGSITGGTGYSNTLTKAGSGRLIFSGSLIAQKRLLVSAGTLQLAKQVSLFNNNEAQWTKGNLTVNSGGTLALNVGGTGEFTQANVTSLLTELTSGINNNGLRSGARIEFDTSNAAGGVFEVSNAIGDSTGTGGGAIGIIKAGTGTLVLSAANTYTGSTTISEGTLVAGTATAFGTTGSVSIAAAATLGIGANVDFRRPLTITAGGRVRAGDNSSVELPSVADLEAWESLSPLATGTLADILYGAGPAGTRILASSWQANPGGYFSDILDLTGTGADTTWVLSMQYDQAATAPALLNIHSRSEGSEFAALGTDFVGTVAWSGAFTTPGQYGVDLTAGTVWVVTDTNSQFVVAVPEPGTALLAAAAVAAAGVAARRARRRGKALADPPLSAAARGA